MAEFFTSLNDKHRSFIAEQPIFFVATAPKEGRINLSPKGLDTLRVVDDNTIAYLDFVGSGNETAAHLLDDGRMTIMLCSFTRNPLILRLYGHGRSVQPGDEGWDALISLFEEKPNTRQVFVMTVETVQTSCGYGVPVMTLDHPRDTLDRWAENKGEADLRRYKAEKNATSIDGLPTGLKVREPAAE